MKKNKKSIKKLTLNKKVVSNLEEGQINGGTGFTIIACPQSIYCPSVFCISAAIPCPIITTTNIPSIAGGCPTTYLTNQPPF